MLENVGKQCELNLEKKEEVESETESGVIETGEVETVEHGFFILFVCSLLKVG